MTTAVPSAPAASRKRSRQDDDPWSVAGLPPLAQARAVTATEAAIDALHDAFVCRGCHSPDCTVLLVDRSQEEEGDFTCFCPTCVTLEMSRRLDVDYVSRGVDDTGPLEVTMCLKGQVDSPDSVDSIRSIFRPLTIAERMAFDLSRCARELAPATSITLSFECQLCSTRIELQIPSALSNASQPVPGVLDRQYVEAIDQHFFQSRCKAMQKYCAQCDMPFPLELSIFHETLHLCEAQGVVQPTNAKPAIALFEKWITRLKATCPESDRTAPSKVRASADA
jgi:hypothetical protein